MIVKKSIAKRIYDSFYVKLFPDYRKELERAVRGSQTLLDVGCGSQSPIYPFSHKLYCVGVDCYQPSIDKSKAAGIHKEYVKANILELDKHFEEKSFDCVLASDVIEHLPKKDGIKFMESLERIARKKVIIYTPNGFMPQEPYDNNPWQEHKSGWHVEEMRGYGYRVAGIHGWKPLRGEFANLKFKPKLFWMGISDVTQWLTRKYPKQAFQILCVKEFYQQKKAKIKPTDFIS